MAVRIKILSPELRTESLFLKGTDPNGTELNWCTNKSDSYRIADKQSQSPDCTRNFPRRFPASARSEAAFRSLDIIATIGF